MRVDYCVRYALGLTRLGLGCLAVVNDGADEHVRLERDYAVDGAAVRDDPARDG